MRTNINQHGCRAPARLRRRGGTQDRRRASRTYQAPQELAATNPGHSARQRGSTSASGARPSAPSSDEARFQRYRDVRDGGTLDRLRVYKDTDAYRYSLQADHVGYRDQRFSASYMNYGKVKASFEWNQIPLFYSQDTRTLYDTSTPGQLTLSDSVQSGIQNKTLTLNNALGGASVFDLRTRRDVANFALTYSATPNVDLNVNFRNTQKTGAYPWGGSFGISGAIATEPVPVDHRTTDFGTNLEYANDRGYARFGYDGSFFHNNVTTLTWDNPSRVTDSRRGRPGAGAHGALAEHRDEHGQRSGRAQPARPQPRHRVPVGRQHDEQQPAAAVHHQQRARVAGARSRELRHHGAR